MDEIRDLFKRGNVLKCMELLENIADNDWSFRRRLQKQINLNVCRGLYCLINKDKESVIEIEEILHKQYQTIAALRNHDNIVPIEIELVAEVNYLFWLLQVRRNFGINDTHLNRTFELLNDSFRRILDVPAELKTYSEIEEDLLYNMSQLKTSIFSGSFESALLVLEVIIGVFALLFETQYHSSTTIKLCGEVIEGLLKNLGMFLPTKTDVMDDVFKFCLYEISGNLSDLTEERMLMQLSLLSCVCKYLQKDFLGCLKHIRKIRQVNGVWSYLGALSSFLLELDKDCLGYLLKASPALNNSLRCRYDTLLGRLYCQNGDYVQALKEFKKALDMDTNSGATLYYLGMAYCKMGLYDKMTDSFEQLVHVTQGEHTTSNKLPTTLEEMALSWIHPEEEILLTEAYYALAWAHGLNKKYQESADTFERCLASSSLTHLVTESQPKASIVTMPSASTVLHEASVMNLLSGNLTRAEQLCLDALDRHCQGQPQHCRAHKSGPTDIAWLQEVVQHELGLAPYLTEPVTPTEPQALFESDLLLDEDLVGLMILSDIRRAQEDHDEFKNLMGKQLSLVSKSLAKAQKDPTAMPSGTTVLMKALAAKCCSDIAVYQANKKPDECVERMFKRALSCNHGDRDVLYQYSSYLLTQGKSSEAKKLLMTFHNKSPTTNSEQCHSLALRYLLRDQVSSRDFDKLVKPLL